MMARVCPFPTPKLMFLIVWTFDPGYPKLTSLNSMVPPSFPPSELPPLILGSLSRTSSILLALIDALGYARMISVIIMNALRTWMAYEENTIISEKRIICASTSPSLAIRVAPIQ